MYLASFSNGKEIFNKHWKNYLEFWSFGSHFKVSCKIQLLREICIFLVVVWACRQNFFSLVSVSDLEFVDRTSPIIYLEENLTRDMGAQSWLGRYFWGEKWRLFVCLFVTKLPPFFTLNSSSTLEAFEMLFSPKVRYEIENSICQQILGWCLDGILFGQIWGSHSLQRWFL